MMPSCRMILSAVAAAIVGVLSSHAWGMPTLSVVGRGNGLFDVLGEGLEGVGGITLNVEYDLTAAANPRVALGELFSGAMMVPNLTQPGRVRIGIISGSQQGISGKGRIATLTLGPVAGSQGRIGNVTAQLVSAAGGRDIPVQIRNGAAVEAGLPVTGSLPSPGDTGSGVSGSPAETMSRTGGATIVPRVTGPGVAPGSVVRSETSGGVPQPSPVTSAPADSEPAVAPPPEAPEAPTGAVEVKEVAPPTSATARLKVAPRRSILDLFREYVGERTPAALGALFAAGASPDIRQEPPIALSDGATTVTVFLNVPGGAGSPNFALSGAKLASLRKEGGLYLLELRPEGRVNEVRVSVLNDGGVTTIPLNVAQLLDPARIAGGSFTESAVTDFLKGVPGKRRDLNGDGVVNFVDDYIIMANYLVREKAGAPKPPAPAPAPDAVNRVK